MKMVKDDLKEAGGTKLGIVRLGKAAGKVRELVLGLLRIRTSGIYLLYIST